METTPTIRAEIGPTLKLAIPIMLGMLGYGLMFYVDVAMAGHLGETALAASALASNLNYIPYVFGIGVVGAIAVYQSQDNGAGVEESAPAILRHGMALALVIGVTTAALSHALVGYLPLLGSSPAVTAEAREFFILMSWAMIPGLLFHALRGHRDSQHQPWISLAWLSVGILANILLNWLWMFGHWGFPAIGLAGAGWATLVARCVMLLGLWFTPGRGEVRWADGLQLTVFDRLLKTGWPAGLPIDLYRRPADSWIATFLGSANLIPAKVVHVGAGEFVAETAVGEVRGALATPDSAPGPGAKIIVCVRPECLKLDFMAPDENAFAGTIVASLFQGDVSLHDFKTKEGVILRISEANPRQRVGSKATVFAWAEPEDVVGLNR